MLEEELSPPKHSGPSAMGWFPLIRNVSRLATPRLAAMKMTPNQITTLGLFSGLTSTACFAFGDATTQMLGAVLFFLYYLFDHCDGELARMRGMSSRFGTYYDDFVDWIVHSSFFLALGYHTTVSTGNEMWMWLGMAASFGGTVNAILPLIVGRAPEDGPQVATFSDLGKDPSVLDVVIFAFRGLARADFWLVVLGLAIIDQLWVLLPAAAIGAQVFWLLYLKASVRRIKP